MPVSTQSTDLESTQTITSQVNKSYSGSVQEVAGAADGFLKSLPSSTGQSLSAVNTFAASLGKAGMAVSSSVSQALNQLGSLGSYTKFKDNFVPPEKLRNITPEESYVQRPGYKGDLYYPNDLGEYYIIFAFSSYRKSGPMMPKQMLKEATIYLPIPANLQEQFGMQYADKQLGVLGALEDKVSAALQGRDLFTEEGAKAAGKAINALATDQTALMYGARALTGAVDAATGLATGAAVEKATGAILNPFQSLIFQGINLRSHSFTYRFSPNSQAENNSLKKIIYEFKRRMHPAKEGFLLRFPDVVNISFGKKNGEPYFFKECFLESMSVNYAPQGTPAFFVETNNPVEVEIALNFKETSPVTREEFKAPEEPSYY